MIHEDDIALVREKTDIAEVISEHLQLRNAGGGNLKGLCPFHDEKSPSFNVTPERGMYYCFGCGAGGDAIKFLQEIERLDFTEAVTRLAERAKIPLRVDDTAPTRGTGGQQRARLIAAHAAAAAFYAEQLMTSADAALARQFLTDRGFDKDAAEKYGCGFAPAGWDALTRHLLALGYTEQELTVGGLSRPSDRGGLIDRFHRRLLWPIRTVTGDVVGFGARRLFDDDKVEAKYLNTPETPIYKKNELLYGVDLAKRDIGQSHRAVIVEGYTDVMACHLAGVTTAVATCGTAFGGEHVKLLRRLLSDSDTWTGEVIFTFDGDNAGMKAAERAFKDDQKFAAQTFVAIEPTGMDPCELRQKSGGEAVRDLVNRRVPLVQFVLRSTVARYDLNTAEGRVTALDKGIPLVAQIKDRALRDEYARMLAGLVGMDDPMTVVRRVRGAERATDRAAATGVAQPAVTVAVERASAVHVTVEREALKLAIQHPDLVIEPFAVLGDDAFTDPTHRAVHAAIVAAGGVAAAGPTWADTLLAVLPPELHGVLRSLAVEPLRSASGADTGQYANSILARVHGIVAGKRVAELKSRLQRLDQNDAEYLAVFRDLTEMETYRRALRDMEVEGVAPSLAG